MEQKQQTADLVERCRQNDRKAQRIVFDMYKDSMLALCRRYAKSDFEAEDALIEGFLKVFLNIGSYTGKGAFASWVKRVFVNSCINLYREEFKHNLVDRMTEFPEDDFTLETSERFSKEELRKALDSLSQRQRTIFNMVVIDEYSYFEAAKVLGTSADVIKTVLYRTKQKLKIYLTEREKQKGKSL